MPAGHCDDWTVGCSALVFRDATTARLPRLVRRDLARGAETVTPAPRMISFTSGTPFAADPAGGAPIYLRFEGASRTATMRMVRR